MNRKNRILAGILCVMFVAVLFVSGAFIATHLHHVCPGENCAVCAAISGWERLTRGMTLAAAFGCAALFALRSGAALSSVRAKAAGACTLVALKVKLSD